MAVSINKVTLIGNIGNDPEVRTMQNGDKVCNLSLATSESWKDKQSGERKERTEWHRIVIFNQGLVKLAENYLGKGSKIYLEGQLETRSYEKDGQKVYTTEVVLRPYAGEIVMLDAREGGKGGGFAESTADRWRGDHRPPMDELEDEVPF